MNKGLCLALAVGGLTLAGCGNNRGPLPMTPATVGPLPSGSAVMGFSTSEK